MSIYLRVCVFVFVALFVFLYKLRKERNRFRRQSLPGPPHNWLLGHFPVLFKIASRYPKDLNFIALQSQIAREYNLETHPVWYLDLWPLSPLSVIVLDGRVASQVAQKRCLPKYAKVMEFSKGFMGEMSFVPATHTEGPAGHFWRFWRAVFNPGFSMQNLLTMVPLIAEEALVFAGRLRSGAESAETLLFEHLTNDLTVDIIGRVVVDARFRAQKGKNELIEALQMLPKLTVPPGSLNPLARFNVIRILRHRYWENKTDTLVGQLLDSREKRRREGLTDHTKRVTDLALQSFNDESGRRKSGNHGAMDPTFRLHTIQNIRGFIFAGHETSSGTLAYVFRLLSAYPAALSALRAEHASVFPSARQPSDIAAALSTTPTLLSKLPYTTAVIHETLRMFPAAGTVRIGSPSVPLRSPSTASITYPTHISGLDLPIIIGGYCLGRNRALFADADTFRPERFLEDPHLANSDLFRPFERGPRDCIGKELAMLEMKVALAVTVGWFAVELAYETTGEKGREVEGEVAYPVLVGAMKPVGGLPVKVRKVEREGVSE